METIAIVVLSAQLCIGIMTIILQLKEKISYYTAMVITLSVWLLIIYLIFKFNI